MKKTLVGVLAAAAVLVTAGCSSGPSQEEQDNSAMATACKDRVLDSLKSPGTAQFGEMTVGPNTSTVPLRRETGEVVTLTHQVESWVDSQNSYGALIRGTFRCEMYMQEDGTAFASWNGVIDTK